MPLRGIPLGGAGLWRRLQADDGVELWRRDFARPDGSPLTMFYVGSDAHPDVERHADLTAALSAFERHRPRAGV